MVVKPSKRFPSKISSGKGSVRGDRKLFPRVGPEYQAEIPELIEAPFNGGIKVDTSDSFSLGLPVPVTWIHNKAQVNGGELIEITNNHEVDSVEPENSENGHTTLVNGDGELKIGNGEAAGLLNLPSMLRGESTDIDSVSLQEKKAPLDHSDGFSLVPGLPNKDWTPIECSSFLLGLYAFGKNLALIRRFVGNKEMGDILSYYYGKFYNSIDHQKWSESRKLIGRRCISGHKLFVGLRKHEILMRISLSSCVSEECNYMLLKVSKLFGDGRISLEEYVFWLRDNIGMDNLVEVVGVGRGKMDLSGTAMGDQTTLPDYPRPPKTKACSSLTTTEILKFLTGNFPLSKAEMEGIFWGAVWPRLIARGWRSEQPRGVVSARLKRRLVFLVPHVNKFSRSLAKGTHFFSSISDVLNKVASEPSLLELKEKRVMNPEREGDPVASQKKKKKTRNSELQQNNSASNQHLMEFTVVDTSLFTGGGRGKAWEVRTLPLDGMDSSSSGHPSEEHHGSDPVGVDNVEKHGDADNDITTISKDQLPNGPVSVITEEKITHLASISEHKNLAVCSSRGLSHETENRYRDDDCMKDQSSFPDAHANQLAVPSQNMLSDSSFSEQSHKNSTLNHSEDDQVFSTNTLNNPDSLSAAKQSSSPSETDRHSETLESINAGAITAEPPPITTSRRQSSRSKPSAKALEAIAYGFMGASKKRKSANSSTSTSTSSQRVRGG